ncbi:SCO family protein [Tumebacillus sp. DT12]|uniref:SCO family protein n=1 Tax=Tumebacillus lacus TaxID=2995335 RepID=A0ABT3WYA4_9BACL|nr:SCO family protein [Tumebacillus lacus]MCX7569660.1 SCO family protein [Tumebacillus lacus]
MNVLRRAWFPVTAGLLALILIGGLVYWFWWGYTRLPISDRAPDVQLQTLNGEQVSFHEHAGKVRLVEFYYAKCPDICPVTTANMVQIQNRLKEKGLFGTEVEFVSITFDPTNDTPDVIREYANRLGIDPSGWLLLTGTEEQTKKAAEDFGVYVQKEADGTFTHSVTSLQLVDEKNNIRKTYKMGEGMPVEEVYSDIMNLLND